VYQQQLDAYHVKCSWHQQLLLMLLVCAAGEDKLLLLINKASSEEQVQAAVAAVRANHLKRQRIRQAEPHSPQVFSALLKVRSIVVMALK
jgi:hypothetical protein